MRFKSIISMSLHEFSGTDISIFMYVYCYDEKSKRNSKVP